MTDKFCGVCWTGQGKIRMHYCDEPSAHEGPHHCHCGAILEKPVRLAPLKSAYVKAKTKRVDK
jgi:predicted amidophosphoribosyltransferase